MLSSTQLGKSEEKNRQTKVRCRLRRDYIFRFHTHIQVADLQSECTSPDWLVSPVYLRPHTLAVSCIWLPASSASRNLANAGIAGVNPSVHADHIVTGGVRDGSSLYGTRMACRRPASFRKTVSQNLSVVTTQQFVVDWHGTDWAVSWNMQHWLCYLSYQLTFHFKLYCMVKKCYRHTKWCLAERLSRKSLEIVMLPLCQILINWLRTSALFSHIDRRHSV